MMIAVLLMFLLFAVLQVAVYFYIRNIVTARSNLPGSEWNQPGANR